LLKTGDEEAVSVRAVAQAVGVTPPSIYLHFADKDELLVAVCEHQFRQFDDFVEQRVAGIDDPVEQLVVRGRAYVQFGIEHPEHYRILFMNKTAALVAAGDDERLATVSGFDHLLDNVTRCRDAGALVEEDVLLVATGLWAMVHGVTSLAISVPGFPLVGLDRLQDHMGAVCATGLFRSPHP
jgi:AcrR family transcriptional regulator